jgi:RUN domain
MSSDSERTAESQFKIENVEGWMMKLGVVTVPFFRWKRRFFRLELGVEHSPESSSDHVGERRTGSGMRGRSTTLSKISARLTSSSSSSNAAAASSARRNSVDDYVPELKLYLIYSKGKGREEIGRIDISDAFLERDAVIVGAEEEEEEQQQEEKEVEKDEEKDDDSDRMSSSFSISTCRRTYYLRPIEPDSKEWWIGQLNVAIAHCRQLALKQRNLIDHAQLVAASKNDDSDEGARAKMRSSHAAILLELGDAVDAIRADPGNDRLVRGRFCTALTAALRHGFAKHDKASPEEIFGAATLEPRNIFVLFMATKSKSVMGSRYSASLAACVGDLQRDYRQSGDLSVMFRSLVVHALNKGKLHVWLRTMCNSPTLLERFYSYRHAFLLNVDVRTRFIELLLPLSRCNFALDVGFEFHVPRKPKAAADVGDNDCDGSESLDTPD